MNQSKVRSPRWWTKWQALGAVGDCTKALLRYWLQDDLLGPVSRAFLRDLRMFRREHRMIDGAVGHDSVMVNLSVSSSAISIISRMMAMPPKFMNVPFTSTVADIKNWKDI